MNQLTQNSPTVAIRRKFHIGTGRTGHRVVRDTAPPAQPPAGRIPRISRLMALAIRFEQLIRDGVVKDQADLARLAHISLAAIRPLATSRGRAPTGPGVPGGTAIGPRGTQPLAPVRKTSPIT